MRKWWWVGGGLVALLAGAVALAALNVDRILETQRPRIQSELSRILGREVSLGQLAVSFRNGLGVRVGELRIGEDPAFGEGDFVSAGEVLARVALLPALLGDLQVAQVRLVEPSVSVIRRARGLSIESLGGARGGEPPPPAGAPDASPPLSLAIANLKVEGGSFRYVDETSRPRASYEIAQLGFSAENLSLVRPAAFRLSASLLGSPDVNLWLEGEVGPLRPESPADSRVDLELRLEPVTFEQLRGIPALASALPRELLAEGPMRLEATAAGSGGALAVAATLDAAGARVRYLPALDKQPGEPLRFVFEGERQGRDLRIDRADFLLGATELSTSGRVENLDAPTIHFSSRAPRLVPAEFGLASERARSAEELRDVTLEGTIRTAGGSPHVEARLRSPGGSLRNADYRDLEAKLGLRSQRASIDSLSVQALGGKVAGRGVYDMSRPERPDFEMTWDLAGIRLEELVATQTRIGAQFIEGELATDLSVRGSGSTWDQIKPVLAGLGNARVTGGVLRDLNLADTALQGLTGVAGLTDLLSPKLRERYKGLLGAAHTAFDDLSGAFEIRDGAIHLPALTLRAADFALRGKGRLTLDAELDVDATLTASQALSQALLEEAKPVRYLVGSSGAVEIPLHIGGGLPAVTVAPDAAFVAQALQRALVGGALDKLLEQVPKGEAPVAGGAPGPAPGAPAAPADAAAAIEQGLRGLLGRKKKSQAPDEGAPAEAPAQGGAPAAGPPAEPSTP